MTEVMIGTPNGQMPAYVATPVGQRPASASADDQDVTRLARDGDEHGAGLAARHSGAMVRSADDCPQVAWSDSASRCQPLPGIFGPDAAQVETGHRPGCCTGQRLPAAPVLIAGW